MRRVVVTAVGTVNPIGNNVEDTWKAILNKECGIEEMTHINIEDFKVKLGAEVKNLNLEDYLDPKEVKNNDRFINLALVAAQEAMRNAKLDLETIDKSRFGVLVASGIGGLKGIQETAITCHERGPGRISPYFIPKSLINLAPGQIAIKYGAEGYVSSVVTACAAGTNAIGDAYLRILANQEDVIITGSSEACMCEIGIGGFQSMRALSLETDKAKASMPFDKDRSGFVMGEGAAILVLEELEHAKARNATILAEVVGYGCSCDASHITAPKLDGSGGASAIAKAIKSANLNPEDITYFNAHGTSTKLNDATETKAINLVFKDHTKNLYVSSTKGNTGHLLGGTGSLEAIFCIKSLQESIIIPTINTSNIDEEINLNLPLDFVKKDYTYALSNSLGFGGHNASIIFKKWDN
ncbi:MAG: beta-ketoacyl-ACP synthase II [bacterium]